MVGLIVPTLNAGEGFHLWIDLLKQQSLQPERVLVVDSSSDDGTATLAQNAGFEVLKIPRSEFDHGATRQLAADHLSDMDILIFMTQDALLANQFSLQNLVACFSDESVGAAYGRQLPHISAGPIAAHAREFNYGKKTEVRSLKDMPKLGIKCAFVSNSFSAYRKESLLKVGGFPPNAIVSEDTYAVAKMLMVRYKIAYCAEALVYHSHDYSYFQEVKRYFDIGVFHSREPWIIEVFGAPEGEGKRFVLSEIRYLVDAAPWLIPSSIIRTVLKYSGFRLGLIECRLPMKLKKKISMQSAYWK